MATRLYLHAATDSTANLPTAEQSSKTSEGDFEGSQTTNRQMTTTIGAAQTSLARNTLAGDVLAHTYYCSRWVSPPLDQTSIAANTWTYNFAAQEQAAATNFPVAGNNVAVPVNCYVWRPGTGKIGTILDGNTAATVDEATSGEVAHHVTFSGSAVASVQTNDVIIFEAWFTVDPATGGNDDTMTFYYDGTTANTTDNATVSNHASFIETPENLTFFVASQNYNRAPATETVTLSESIIRSVGLPRSLPTETTTSSESITRLLAATRNPIETTNSTETLTRLQTLLRPIDSETTTISDAVERVKGIPRSIDTETVTISDDLQRMLAATRTLQEDTIISETLTRLLAANRSLETQTVNITDQVERIRGLVRSIDTENVTVSDSVNRLLTATRTLEVETTTITDAITRLLVANRAILETVTITDSVVGVVQGAGATNYERSISETVVISESLNRMLAATRTIENENVSVSDNVSRLLTSIREILETTSLVDSLTRQLAAYRSVDTETTTVSDSLIRLLTRVRTIIENIDITDSVTRAFVGARPILDIVNITDSVIRLITPFEIPTRLKKIRTWLTANYTENDPSL